MNGDMIARDAKYHKVFLSNFYQKTSANQHEGHYTEKEHKLHGITFGQVISFIEETVANTSHETPVF